MQIRVNMVCASIQNPVLELLKGLLIESLVLFDWSV